MNHADDFDVASVPTFPVFSLKLNEDEQWAELDGVRVEPALGEDFKTAAIQAVVTKARRDALRAVRVRVRAADEDESVWDMIVTEAGEVIDTTENEEPAQPATRSRRRWPLILVGGVVAAAVATAGVLVGVGALNRTPEAPQWQIPGAEAQIPIGLPTGFSDRAAWSVPVDDRSTIAQIDTGHILSTTPEGILTARDPQTAQVHWRGSDSPAKLAGTLHTDWAGRASLVNVEGTMMRIWDLRTPEGGGVVSPETIRLDPHWRAEPRGALPFIDLGDWVIGLPAARGNLSQVDIPAGTRPLGVSSDRDITTASDRELLTVNDNGEVTQTRSYDRPAGTRGAPSFSRMLDDDHALIGWDTDREDTLAILQLSTATLRSAETVPRLPAKNDQLIIDESSQAAATTGVALNWGQDPMIRPLERFTATTISAGTAYGTAGQDGPAALDLTTSGAQPESWPTFTPGDPAPNLVTGDAAYVIAPRLEQTFLYRASTKDTP